MVMGWLLSSMKSKISEHYLFLETAHQIWDALVKTYSQIRHAAKVYDLWQRIAQFRQGDQTLAIYYSSCVTDAAAYKKHVEEIHIFELLTGLNSKYEQIRVQILNMNLSTSLNEVYAYVYREKSRQGVMNVTSSIEKSALVSNSTKGYCGGFTKCGRGDRLSNFSYDKDQLDRDQLKCEHCDRSRHTKQQCWDLHGWPHDQTSRSFPQGGSSTGQGGRWFGGNKHSAHLVTSVTPNVPPMVPSSLPSASTDGGGLSSEEIAAFHQFVSQLDHSFTTPTSSFSHSGTSAFTLSTSVNTPQCSWIIDSKASHHMTGKSSLFTSYCVCY